MSITESTLIFNIFNCHLLDNIFIIRPCCLVCMQFLFLSAGQAFESHLSFCILLSKAFYAMTIIQFQIRQQT